MGKSVYNFVPAPEENEVFKPDWAKQAQHDMPFSDGETGEIEIKITAETPIYIRNGHTEQDKKRVDEIRKNGGKPQTDKEKESWKRYHSFSNVDGRYFIPATSLKGMIRNTLEIFSFSRLNPDLVDDNRYSFRDLRRNSEYLKKYNSNAVKSGWLSQDKEGNWIIEECQTLEHIHHDTVDDLLKGKYKNNFIGFRKSFFNKNPKQKTAKWKYEQVDVKDLQVVYNGINGKIVFTGQSSKRNEGEGRPSGKVHEFFFSDKVIATHKISEKMQKDFRFIYHEGQTDESKDWRFWRNKLKEEQKVPVFFNKISNKVKHLGLAYMYKLPYEKSIHEISPIKQYLKSKEDNGLDLATAMFGYTTKKENEKKALKGRVFFGHSFATIEPKELELKKLVLSSPKASFYPYYLTQKNIDKRNKVWKYTTYDDKNASVRGFKRYPIRKSLKQDGEYDNNSIKTSFIPLDCINQKDEKLEFKSKIRFFNLKKVEVGALLSALTFHLQENCYHNLGMAKPFGYGKVKIEVSKLKSIDNRGVEKIITNKDELQQYLICFEELMNSAKENWINSSSLKELFAMAFNDKDFSNLEYPILTEFRKIKKDKKFLKEFSKVDKSTTPNSQGNNYNRNNKHKGKNKKHSKRR